MLYSKNQTLFKNKTPYLAYHYRVNTITISINREYKNSHHILLDLTSEHIEKSGTYTKHKNRSHIQNL
jgi:hypothetical protein